MADELAREVLQKEVSDLHEWLRFTWTEFLKWFTFFCTLNVAAIGALHFIDLPLRPFVEFIFITLNIGGMFICAITFCYTRLVSFRMEETYKKLKATYPNEVNALISPTAPTTMAAWFAIFMIAAFLLFIAVWEIFLWFGV